MTPDRRDSDETDDADLVALGRVVAAVQDARATGAPVPPFAAIGPGPGRPRTRRQWLPFVIGVQVGALVVGAGILAKIGVDWWEHHRPGVVVVTVVGAPSASVTFDDRPAMRAEPSLTIEHVATGTHTVVVEEPGFATFSTQIVARADTPLFAVKAPLKQNPAHVFVTSSRRGATIVVDGRDVGKRTPAVIEIEPGKHAIALSNGPERALREVDVPSTGELVVDMDLKALPEINAPIPQQAPPPQTPEIIE